MPHLTGCSVLCLGLLLASGLQAEESKQKYEFFEKQIRPVLVKRCYKCHSSEADEVGGGLLLDSRDGMLTGGDSGPAIVPGDTRKSLLMRAIRYQSEDFEMPPDGKLKDEVIQAFGKWIEAGAADPR